MSGGVRIGAVVAAVGVGAVLGWIGFRNAFATPDATASTPTTDTRKHAVVGPPPPKQPDREPTVGADLASVKPRIDDKPAPTPAPDGMKWIPGGVFMRGSDEPAHADARPWHAVELDGFWLDETPVTNAQFAAFVAATGYVTVAEKAPKGEEFKDAPPEALVPGAIVFSPPDQPVSLDSHFRWWKYVPGAQWRHPEGPKSNLDGRAHHPVVQVAFDDVLAYCKWAEKRLPTEAEFEFAARGGLDRQKYAWGGEFCPKGKWMANTWQGRFPTQNLADDGFRRAAPVGSYPPNGYGLRDMAGNVWQWCADWYREDYYRTLALQPQPAKNPLGPPDSFDPAEPQVPKRIHRGGSYLCTDEYCTAYEVGARGKGAVDTGTNHLGFRCARSAAAK